MPEMLEIEMYRASAEPLVGRRITAVDAPDDLWASRAPDIVDVVTGRRLVAARRQGKVLLLVTDGPVIGLRFGMTGRLVVDGTSAVDDLAYGAHGDDPAWVRLTLRFGRRAMWVSDPRRLGRVELDPVLDGLGPDAWGIDADTLARRLGASAAPIKVALLDQHRVAGLGNMLADEVLLRAGIHPARPCRSLSPVELSDLADAIAEALPQMLASGGSHSGLLAASLRHPDAPCPLDGAPLQRIVLGGRSAYACSVHQR